MNVEPGTLHVHVATCTRAVYLLLVHVQSQERALCNNCTKKQLCNSLHRKFKNLYRQQSLVSLLKGSLVTVALH